MTSDINVIIGEDPGVILEKAFASLHRTISQINPINLIALQLQGQSTTLKSKPKKNNI